MSMYRLKSTIAAVAMAASLSHAVDDFQLGLYRVASGERVEDKNLIAILALGFPAFCAEVAQSLNEWCDGKECGNGQMYVCSRLGREYTVIPGVAQ